MYQIRISRNVKKDCRSPALYLCIDTKVIPYLQINPEKAKRLSGPLSRFYTYRFSFEGTPFRVCYSIDFETKTVIIHAILPRKDVYRILLRRAND